MGGTASVVQGQQDDDDERNFQMFQDLTKLYENKYMLEIKTGRMTEREVYAAVKDKFLKLSQGSSSDNVDVPKDLIEAVRFQVGDVVRVKDRGLFREGVVIECSKIKVKVDFGEHIRLYNALKCILVVKADEYEVGDRVEIQTAGMALYFVGEVVNIQENGTIDVKMAGDDSDDIEYGVPHTKCRKLMTVRAIAKDRRTSNVGMERIHLPFLAQNNHATNNTNNNSISPKRHTAQRSGHSNSNSIGKGGEEKGVESRGCMEGIAHMEDDASEEYIE